MLPAKLSFVDVETSGSSLRGDRIIEIGIIRVEDGQVVSSFQSLINPDSYLSPFITSITGITSAELESAPTFRQIADEVFENLDESIFVAHNAVFDYGFLRSEFTRLGYHFKSPRLCTVKLSRAIYPQYPDHNLDALIHRYGFTCESRHRAFADAQVLWQFWQHLVSNISSEVLLMAVNRQLRKPQIPIHLSSLHLENLPEKPGVYIFYSADGTVLYIGKSINLKDRILSHFTAQTTSPVDFKISQSIASLETFSTTSELTALILESQLIKSKQPIYNRLLRRSHNLVYLTSNIVQQYTSITINTSESIISDDLSNILGIFTSLRQAKDYLLAQADKYSLCHRLLGLEKTNSACFKFHLGKCNGACLGRELPLRYNLRVAQAFADRKIMSWPFPGPINREGLEINNWCLADSEFDYDTYLILKKFLLKHA